MEQELLTAQELISLGGFRITVAELRRILLAASKQKATPREVGLLLLAGYSTFTTAAERRLREYLEPHGIRTVDDLF